MSKITDSESLQRRVFALAFEDGLWDVLVGTFVLEFVVAPLLTSALGDLWSGIVMFPVWAAVAGAILILKRSVVIPRRGLVSLRLPHQRRAFGVGLASAVALTVMLVAGTALFLRVRTSVGLQAVFVAVVVVVMFAVGAHVLRQPRYLLYGGLVALAPLLGEWLSYEWELPHHGYPIAFGAAALAIITSGVARFVRFLRAYRVPTEVQG